MVEHRDVGGIQIEAKTEDTMPRLQGGAHSEVYDGASEADAHDRARN